MHFTVCKLCLTLKKNKREKRTVWHQKLFGNSIFKRNSHILGNPQNVSVCGFFLLAQPIFRRRILFISSLQGKSSDATILGAKWGKRTGVPLGFHLHLPVFTPCLTPAGAPEIKGSDMASLETLNTFLLLEGARAPAREAQGGGGHGGWILGS